MTAGLAETARKRKVQTQCGWRDILDELMHKVTGGSQLPTYRRVYLNTHKCKNVTNCMSKTNPKWCECCKSVLIAFYFFIYYSYSSYLTIIFNSIMEITNANLIICWISSPKIPSRKGLWGEKALRCEDKSPYKNKNEIKLWSDLYFWVLSD